MPDFTQKSEPKLTPDQPNNSDLNISGAQSPLLRQTYSELDFIAASNSLLAKIEGHLKSIRSMLTFFVVIVVLSIILGACSALLSF
jgi:hypothetical protein